MTAKWGQTTARGIIPSIDGELIAGNPESPLMGISTDSREISPGQFFWALKGERYDGHDFVKKAVEKGASGIVIKKGYRPEIPTDRDLVIIAVEDTLKALGDLAGWWRHQHDVRVAAITGSVGKTTTKEMTANILELDARTLKNSGNLNNLVGLPLTILQMEENHRRAVLEMGMNRPGEIARLTEIADPDIGLITNVARAHIEGVGNISGVAKAKAELLEKISPESQVILNGDDELLMRVASQFPKKIMTYGLGSRNDIRAENILNLGRDGFSFDLRYQENSVPIRLRSPGLQNVFNALAASSIAICLEEPYDRIVEGLYGFRGIKGRFTLNTLPGGITLVDDTYNSNPSSLRAAIDSVKALMVNGGRVIIGLGEMLELGDETVPAHIEAGGMVAELGVYYFVAMGEHAPEMIKGAITSGFSRDRAVVVNTHEEMGEKIREIMKKGDLILLKGSRGMALEKVSKILKNGS